MDRAELNSLASDPALPVFKTGKVLQLELEHKIVVILYSALYCLLCPCVPLGHYSI